MNTPTADGSVTSIPRALLDPSATNPRKNFTGLDELAHSIRRHGILQPLLVRPTAGPDASQPRYEIVAGERRYRAAELANLADLPARVQNLSDRDVAEIQLIENVQRADLDPLEEARGYQRLMQEHGLSIVDLMEATGRARSTIYGRLALLKMSPALAKALAEGDVEHSIADLIARLPSPELQKEALHAAVGRNMSVRELRKAIDEEFLLNLQTASFDPDDAELNPKAGSCRNCPHNSCISPELFPGIKPWTCTLRPCFIRKTTLASERKLAGLKAAGATVIDPKKAKELFPYEHNPETVSHPTFTVGNRVCYEAKKPNTTVEKLAEVAKIEPTVTINPHTGRLVELFDYRKVLEAVRKLKPALLERDATGSAKPRGEDRKKVIEENRRRREEEDKRLNAFVLGVGTIPGDTFWWRLVIALLDFRAKQKLREKLEIKTGQWTASFLDIIKALEAHSGVSLQEHIVMALLRINEKEVNTWLLDELEPIFKPLFTTPTTKTTKKNARA